MSHTTSFACVTTDTGLASELVHVSPIFVRCGPSRRGRFADRRLARTRRTDARNEVKAQHVGALERAADAGLALPENTAGAAAFPRETSVPSVTSVRRRF